VGALLQLVDGVSWMAARSLGWAHGGGGVGFTPLSAGGAAGPEDDGASVGDAVVELHLLGATGLRRADSGLPAPGLDAASLHGPGRPA
jgi:hypothetical protein